METKLPPSPSWFDPQVGVHSVASTIDYDREGKQFDNLRIVQSAGPTGWHTTLIPVISIRNGDGPTLLLLGGTHGDEVDGPVVLLKLARELQPADIRGSVIIVPALNFPAVEACQRGAPADGRDLNRSFPGKPDGTLAEIIAHYVDNVLLPRSQVVIDLHAGGRELRFLKSLWLLECPDREIWQRTLSVAEAFGAPHVIVSPSLGGDMSESAVRRGCAYLSTEAGGAATVDREVVAMSEAGIRRVMAYLGLLPEQRAPAASSNTRWLRVPGGDGMLLAEDNGHFEPTVDLGDEVAAGQTIGRIHRIEQPMSLPVDVVAPISSLVYGLRWFSQVRRGARLVTFAIADRG